MKNLLKNIAPTLVLIGISISILSSIITFKNLFSEEWGDILYFRGIFVGILFISIGSAAIVKNKNIQDGIISLGSGALSLLFISTLNLIAKIDVRDGMLALCIECKNPINLEWYFDFTFIVVGVVFIILIFIRLWLKQVLRFMNI